ncbi:GyrI-like domain-containing protein [Acidicapsa acidisoli]|uniref:GyrI-like domain-containing protein n=1 Tax=Acidicapsa acidisoli TaxID=1615681 RepID=UPI0021E097BC|nr:GyrI-like domain-containing protein [Acidicapsa acidisoli]
MIETPQILETDEQHYAFLHRRVPTAEIRNVMGSGIREVYSTVAAQGIAPAGPWFTHHLARPGEFFDFEICVPVKEPIQPAGEVKPGIWPSMRVARTVYHGDYDEGEHEGLAGAWPKFMAWIAEQRLTIAEDLWERYLVGPETSSNPADWRTELYRPLVD